MILDSLDYFDEIFWDSLTILNLANVSHLHYMDIWEDDSNVITDEISKWVEERYVEARMINL